MSLSKLQEIVKGREAWRAIVHGIAKELDTTETEQQRGCFTYGHLMPFWILFTSPEIPSIFQFPPPHPMIILREEIAAILYLSWCAALHLKPSVNLQISPDCPWSQVLNSCLGSGWLNVSLTPQTPSSFRPGINCCPSLLSASVSTRCSALSAELNNTITISQ